MSEACIIYLRLSTQNQAKLLGNYLSIEKQYKSCLNYVQNNNLIVVNTVQEIVSVHKIIKRKLDVILNQCSNINIIFYNISRFSRNCIKGLQDIELSRSKKIVLHFVQENLRTDNDEMYHQIRMGLSLSQNESDTISKRVRTTNNLLRSKGWQFGTPPFGTQVKFIDGIRTFSTDIYEYNIINFVVRARIGKITCIQLNELLQNIIPHNEVPIEFFDETTNNVIPKFDKLFTLTYQEIATLLNDYGILKRNNQWSPSSVSNIFHFGMSKIDHQFSDLTI